jgi:hypothetical protein
VDRSDVAACRRRVQAAIAGDLRGRRRDLRDRADRCRERDERCECDDGERAAHVSTSARAR